jgi:plasmid stability protein
MANITIRDIPDAAIAAIDAMLQGKSRESYLRELITQAAESPAPVQLKWNQGLKAIAPSGGNATLKNMVESISSGASNLDQSQFDAFQKARMQADPRNGGNWAEAKKTLESAGFEVYWV